MCNLKIMIDIDIKTILPQKEPFVMISSLLHCDTFEKIGVSHTIFKCVI